MNSNRLCRNAAYCALLSVLLLATGCASTGARDYGGDRYASSKQWPQAKTNYQHDQYAGAANNYGHGSQQTPSNVDSVFRQGTAAYQRGDLTSAERYFTQVLKQDSNHSRATYNLAMIHLHRAYDGLARYHRIESNKGLGSNGLRQNAVQDLIYRLDAFNAGQ